MFRGGVVALQYRLDAETSSKTSRLLLADSSIGRGRDR
jgi:hypothetical protein